MGTFRGFVKPWLLVTAVTFVALVLTGLWLYRDSMVSSAPAPPGEKVSPLAELERRELAGKEKKLSSLEEYNAAIGDSPQKADLYPSQV